MIPEIFQPSINNVIAKADLTEDQIDILITAFKIKKLRKKENLLRPGTVSNHLNEPCKTPARRVNFMLAL